jgi:hypothetical protein
MKINNNFSKIRPSITDFHKLYLIREFTNVFLFNLVINKLASKQALTLNLKKIVSLWKKTLL